MSAVISERSSRPHRNFAAVFALLAAHLLCIPFAVHGAEKAAGTQGAAAGADQPKAEPGSAKPVIAFEPGFMSDSRARSIAEAAGFTYLRWSPCGGNIARCAVIEAQGKQGRVFQYHVSDERCLSSSAHPDAGPIRNADELKPRRPPARSQGRTAKPLGKAEIAAAGEEEGPATNCFGGYRAPTRARLENFFAVDRLGYMLTVDQTHQVIKNGRWTDQFSQITSSWRLPISGTGLTSEGYEHEIFDGDGRSLAKDGEDVSWIASSGDSADASKTELAENCAVEVADRFEDQAKTADSAYQQCKLSSGLPVSPIFSQNLGSMTGGACDVMQYTAYRTRSAAAQQMFADCMANPGRYFPGSYPPEEDWFLLTEEDGFSGATPEKMVFEGGSCPSYTVRIESSKKADGSECVKSTPLTCKKDGQGGCACTPDSRVKATEVCA